MIGRYSHHYSPNLDCWYVDQVPKGADYPGPVIARFYTEANAREYADWKNGQQATPNKPPALCGFRVELDPGMERGQVVIRLAGGQEVVIKG